jgi:hypothetical protein
MQSTCRDIIDEYCYRFNRNMTDGIFENIMVRMIKAEPYPNKLINP